MTLLEPGCLRWFSSFSFAELIGKTMECTRYVDQPPVKAAIHGRVLVWRAQLQTSADKGRCWPLATGSNWPVLMTAALTEVGGHRKSREKCAPAVEPWQNT